ncbi:MAG: hypothetical protein FWH11_01245 [Micrococcales bacterium]|nr:hypothetical protein [Micrococcales bacterium]
MGNIRIEWNMAGFRELRTAPGVMALLEEWGQKIASRAGDGFVALPAEVARGRGRGRVAVVTATWRAWVAQARDHVLERAVGGG